jgi:hypothetical protein
VVLYQNFSVDNKKGEKSVIVGGVASIKAKYYPSTNEGHYRTVTCPAEVRTTLFRRDSVYYHGQYRHCFLSCLHARKERETQEPHVTSKFTERVPDYTA